MNSLHANVIGATGLVGQALTRQLLADDRFEQVRVFVRRNTGLSSPKLEEVMVDYDQMSDWGRQIQGDVLFSCLGTTLKTAGSQAAQYQVDYTYQYQAAEMAAQQGVARYVLVSSAGADPGARVFYSRMKGELDQAVQQLSFELIHIIRPGILEGDRQEDRLGESIGIWLAHRLKWIPGLRPYRPIHGEVVAKAMIQAATAAPADEARISSLGEVFQLAGES